MMSMMLFRRAAMSVLALIIITGTARAQQTARVTDPTTVPELKAEFDRAAKLGLPVLPVISVARMGYHSDASPAKIRTKVREAVDRLAAAREALKPEQAEGEIEAGAHALQVGVPAGVLREFRAAHRSRSLAFSLGVLRSLIAQRVPVKSAVATVREMLAKNVTDQQIKAVADDIPSLIAQGLAPSHALDVRSKGVLSLPQSALPASVAPNRPPPR